MDKLIVKNLSQLKKQVDAGMIIESDNALHKTNKRRLILRKNTVSIISKEYIEESSQYYRNRKYDEDGRLYVEYFTDFGKSRDVRFRENGDIEFLAHEVDSHGHKVMDPSPDFKKGDVWLTVRIFKN